ncbi:MAG: PepSY domain-containing protein [Lachnospiraceae bacterium]|nr:PepSY domain-containing protein [Lachnospiraceae bacterium]
MNNQELKQRIRTAAEHAAPDQLDKILSSCDEQKGEIIQMTTYKKNKKKGIAAFAAAAAALVLCLGIYAFAGNIRTTTVDSVILLDVNPSLSLSVNSKEKKVVQAEALNADAEEVLGDMDLEGTSLEVAVNALIGSMLQKGYLDGSKNSVLVSVESEDMERATQLEQEVSEAITLAMQSDSVEASVLTQTISTSDEELSTLAETYGISLGKAALIQEVISQDATLTFEDLVSLNISEIALLISSRNITTDTVTSTGEVSSDGYIGSNAALEAALTHAGVAASEITKQEIELDSHKGIIVYEVEFETSSMEYEYHINATTGEVVEYESEGKDHQSAGSTTGSSGTVSSDTSSTGSTTGSSGSGSATGDTSSTGSTDTTGSASSDTSAASTTSASTYIGEAKAKEIALADAGFAESDTKYINCWIEYDDGRAECYEVEFEVNSVEYEYKIGLYDGAILKSESESHHHSHSSSASGSSTTDSTGGTTTGTTSETTTAASTAYIGEDAAYQIALTNAGVSSSNVKKYEVKLDNDHNRMIYEVEFETTGKLEYEYEIDALTGEIISVEVDD